MGSWGVKALESDNGLDLIFLLKRVVALETIKVVVKALKELA